MIWPRPSPFFQEAIGLRVGRRFGALGVEMLGASSPVYLLAKAEGTRPSPIVDEVRRYSRHWTPVHLDFVVAELEAAVGRATGAGATIEGETQTHSWGRIAHLAPFLRCRGYEDRCSGFAGRFR